MTSRSLWRRVVGVISPMVVVLGVSGQQTGIFSGQQDIGVLLHKGSTVFDAARGSYTVSGSGDNMWFGTDDFQFAWKKVTGDVAITADIRFVGTGGNAHRKAALLLRQSLDANSVYVDVARHGDGLTSLQYREAPGADTHEVETAADAPERVRIERRGDFAYVFISQAGGKLRFSGAAMRIPLRGDFYAGIGICSHDKDVTESAVFSHVTIESLAAAPVSAELWSTLETVKIASTDRRVAYTAQSRFEAPNWTRDGRSLLLNSGGRIERFDFGSEAPLAFIETSPATQVNNDHGLSPDGSMLAISDESGGKSKVYIVPAKGGVPRLMTPNAPSYWHGWSPDGATIAYTGVRANSFDIYTTNVRDGKEHRLTAGNGVNDDAEYSPDGKYIYFTSERTGRMQIWRMLPDGRNPEQVIDEASNDWFPHLSPDGKWMVYLAYKAGIVGHPTGQDVEVRLMSLNDKTIKVLAKVWGGQGTLDVPSWSPDSDRVAFVSYATPPED